MTGIGPLEPGEGTWAREPAAPRPPPRPRRRRRRTLLILATACAALAAGGALWATRPRPAPAPELPFPAQTVTVTFVGGRSVAPRLLAFDVRLAVETGPPVTVTRVSQPYRGLRAESAPRAPFRTEPGASRTITVTMRVTECGSVPKNAGLPFLEVTLRNTRAIQTQSFILGPRYARYLSGALVEACARTSPSSPKPPRHLNS
ncbi:Tat pathway signal sequence domain protein [Streptomyces sp. NPDC046860]|uniref:Tat pathway signal sequence domain protein n=1 Tax=Streptomyces sp. NPDC046860 TaxID=3154495 RepID=UPI0033D88213